MEYYASRNSLLLFALAEASAKVYGTARLPLLASVASHDLLLGSSRFYFFDDFDYLYYGGALLVERKKGDKGAFSIITLSDVGKKVLSARVGAQFSHDELKDIQKIAESRSERNLFQLFEEVCAFEPVQAGALSELRARLWQLSEAAYVALQFVYEDAKGLDREQEWAELACLHAAKVLAWASAEKWEGERATVLANAADMLGLVLTMNKYRYSYSFEEIFNFLDYYANKNGFEHEFQFKSTKHHEAQLKKSAFW